MNQAAHTMITTLGQPVALEHTSISLDLDDAVATVTLQQRFRNDGVEPVEAVYTFPLPEGAVLLELDVTLGERHLTGAVVASADASRQYEDAIADGDSAVLLEPAGGDLHTLNVGNLLPGESAAVVLRYGQILDWSEKWLRYRLPLTIAPRYGDPMAAGLRPHQSPPVDLLTERSADFIARAVGRLAAATIRCGSHAILLDREGDAQVVRTPTPLVMDRDLVLEIEAQIPEVSAVRVADGDRTLVWTRVQPRLDQSADPRGRALVLVVDNSGSMAGSSIARAREALHRILAALRPQDRFEIIAFGSRSQALFDALAPVDELTLRRAAAFVDGMDAHLGGTELGGALDVAFAVCARAALPADVILITDGHVTDTERLIARARKQRVRLFTVGVALAVSAHLLRELARRTGGACELAAGAESVAGRIQRQFQRIHAPVVSAGEPVWPGKPVATFADADVALFDGDTWHAFAWFESTPEGEVTLTVTSASGEPRAIGGSINLPAGGARLDDATIARLAAALRLRTLELAGDETAGRALALEYQLISPWTQFIAVLVREADEKGSDLPRVARVPHMLAAGYGGLGEAITYCASGASDCSVGHEPDASGVWEHLVMSNESDQVVSIVPDTDPAGYTPALPPEIRVQLQSLLDAGTHREGDILLAWICLREDTGDVDGLDRHLRRRARAWRQAESGAEALIDRVREALASSWERE